MKTKVLFLLPFFVLASCGSNPSSGSISGSSSGSSSIDESISYSEPPIPSWSVAAPPEAKVSDFTLDYHDDWGGYYVSDYKGSMESFQIPSAGQGDHGVAPIVGISSFAFAKRTGVKRIALHDNLRRIEPSAFAESGLEELYVTSGLVDVSVSSFEGTNLKIHGYGGAWFLPGLDFEYKYAYGVKDDTETAVLPEGCVGVMKDAFKNYKKNIVFPKTLAVLPEGWGNQAVANNTYFAGELTGFRYAGPHAFDGILRLKSLRIGKNGIRLESYAFFNLPLFETAVVSPQIEMVGTPFASNKRLQIYVAGSKDAIESKWPEDWQSSYRKPVFGVDEDYEPVVVDGFEVHVTTGSSEASALACRLYNSELSIPATVKVKGKTYDLKVKSGFFAGSNVETVILAAPNIEEGAWSYSPVKKVVLGKTYAPISGNDASFFSIPLPYSNIESFESYSDSIPATNGILGNILATGGVLYRVPPKTKLISYSVPSTLAIGKYAFYNCDSLKTISFGGSDIRPVYRNSFSSGQTVTYKGSVEQWINSRFGQELGYYGNAKFKLNTKAVNIPSSFTQLPSFAVAGLSDITSVTIPSSIKRIPSYMFYGCSSLTSITIPDSVTTIEDRTFQGCTSLRKIIIPASVTTVDWMDPFARCENLTVYFRSSARPKYWSGYAEDSAYKNVTFVYGYKGN